MLTVTQPSPHRSSPRDPWFRERPHVTIAVVGVLFLVVFTVRLVAGSPVDAQSMFYVLPVALAGAAFGRRGGVAAGLVACALIVAWTLRADVSLTPSGWASRVVPILLLGVLLGQATDRAARAELERRRLQRAALLHREAIEINDSLIQRMTAAKWSLEAGQTEAGLRALTVAMSEAQQLVSGLIKRAEMAERTEPLSPPRQAGG